MVLFISCNILTLKLGIPQCANVQCVFQYIYGQKTAPRAGKERVWKKTWCLIIFTFMLFTLPPSVSNLLIYSQFYVKVTNDVVMWLGFPVWNPSCVTVIIIWQDLPPTDFVSENFWYLIVQSGTEKVFGNFVLWLLIDVAVTWAHIRVWQINLLSHSSTTAL
jgi:hypothetical protein